MGIEPIHTQTFPVDPHGPTVAPGFPGRRLEPGTRLSRYVIQECIGEGGMGVVYRAHDPKLNRDVALKLLHPQPGATGEAARERMFLEARALAQLSHPSVVAVHDAGAENNQIYLVMELVRGQTLKEWLAESPRSQRDITRAFAECGRGLVAAHEAGIVHRDFKPANVLCAASGRFCVSDFGIAVAPRLGSLGDAEGIAGTPGYMAPEQRRGQATTPAVDQFSFCVALAEALTGKRPEFDEDGAVGFPGRRLPVRLERLLKRGLSARPEDRFPSMAALVAVLDRTWQRRATWAFVLLLGAATLAAFFLGNYRSGKNLAISCAAGADRIATVWSKQRAQSLQAALSLFGPQDVAARVSKSLEEYNQKWRAMYSEACHATHSRGEQSEELLSRRIACLDRRRRDLGTVVEVVSQPAVSPSAALQAATSLPTLSACADVGHLTGIPAVPADKKSDIEELEDRVARAHALYMLGEFEEGLELAQSALLEARATEYPPIIADALITVGAIHQRLGDAEEAADAWYEASFVAERARLDRVVADARAWLIFPVGFDLGRTEEALRIAEGTRAAIDRLGGDDEIEARYFDHLGSVTLDGLGQTRQAIALYEKSLPLNRRVFGNDHLKVSLTMQNVGFAQRRIGKTTQARRTLEEAVAMTDRALGQSPYQVFILVDEALADVDASRFADARAAIDRGQELFENVPEAPRYLDGDLRRAEAELWLAQGKFAEARKAASRAIKVYEEEGMDVSPLAVWAQTTLGRISLAEGETARAITDLLRCLELSSQLWGEDSMGAAVARAYLAEAYLQAGELDHALTFADDAVTHMPEPGDAPPELSLALLVQAEARAKKNQDSQANAALAQALAAMANREDIQPLRARAQLTHAQLLWKSGHHGAAVFEAAAAPIGLHPGRPQSKLLADRAHSWLKAHPTPR